MLEFWSIHNIALTLMGYPLSYLELLGTIFYLGSVQLITRENIGTWPAGIISGLMYMALFYQIRLYSDFIEQIYYVLVSIYGWWRWRISSRHSDRLLTIRYSSQQQLLVIAGITIGVTLVWGAVMSRIHLVLHGFFPEPASFPYLDALTTVMSFTAMGLMTGKYIESWYYWIIVDAIGIGLYFEKDVKLIALLYVVLLIMAIAGLKSWQKAARTQKKSSNISF